MVNAVIKKKVRYGHTDIDDPYPTMPDIRVPLERATDGGDLGHNTDDDTDSENDRDENRRDQELPEAVWAFIRACRSVLEASG